MQKARKQNKREKRELPSEKHAYEIGRILGLRNPEKRETEGA